MSGTATPIFPQTIVNSGVTINGVTTSTVLVTGSANGTKIESLGVSNTSASAVTINLSVTVGAVSTLLSQFSIPASSGNAATTPPVNLLNNTQLPATVYDNNGNKYIYIASGSTLIATATGTFTGVLAFFAQGGSF
jgi:hypothetical protein